MKHESSTSTKKVVTNAIVYSASGILLKCFTFFLLPLYTAYLTTEDYGITSVVNTFTHTMMYIVALSLYSALMRFYVDLKHDKEKLKRFYGTVSLFTMLSGVFWFAAFTIFRAAASKYIFSGARYFPVILISLLSLFFHCQASIYDDILKSQQKAMKSSIIHIVIFFVTLALNIIFVVVLKWGAPGSLLATLISYVIYTAIFLIDLVPKGEIKFCLDLPLLKDALKYSVPIIPHNLATKIAVLISKILIGGTDSMGSLGVYSVAAQLGEIPDTLQTYVDRAYQPWLYEKLNAQETDFKKTIRSVVRMLIAVLGLLFVCIALFSQDYILLLVDRRYADAWKLVPLIVLVYAIKTIYYFYVEVLFYHKKAVKKLFIATLTSSLLNVFLSFFLIPAYGAMGSIAADAIAMLVRVAIVVLMSRQYENIGLLVRDFVVNFLMVAGFIAAGLLPSFLFFGNEFSILNLGYKTLVVLAFAAVILILHRKQLKPFAQMVKAKLHRKA